MEGHVYKLLELKLRQAQRDEFQTFFANFMGALAPGYFVPIRSCGSLGDGGMDGFLDSNGCVYQCYGVLNGALTNVRGLQAKLKKDFHTALEKQPFMAEWCFVHNGISGIPAEALHTYKEIKEEAAQRGIQTSMFGPDRFRELLPHLQSGYRTELLGGEASLGPALQVVAPEAMEVQAFNHFGKALDADTASKALQSAYWDNLLSEVVHPQTLKDLADANRELAKAHVSALQISDANVAEYNEEFSRQVTFFKSRSGYKLENLFRGLSGYALIPLELANVGDTDDEMVEMIVQASEGTKLTAIDDVRRELDWGLEFPRPKMLPVDNSRWTKSDAFRDALAPHEASDDRQMFRIERIGRYDRVVVPICVRASSEDAKLQFSVTSRKTGRNQILETSIQRHDTPLDMQRMISMLGNASSLMPPEQGYIVRLVTSALQAEVKPISQQAFVHDASPPTRIEGMHARIRSRLGQSETVLEERPASYELELKRPSAGPRL